MRIFKCFLHQIVVFLTLISIALVLGENAIAEIKLVENFSLFDPKDHRPLNWKNTHSYKWENYKVEFSQGKYILRARSAGDAVTIGKEFIYQVKNYPYLSWKWKVVRLPTGGDERYKSTNDSAASVSVIFPNPSGVIPIKTVKYCWSTTLPPGTMLLSPYSEYTRIFIVESGEKKLGQWLTMKRNVYKDYLAAFNEEPPPTRGIAISSDSDNTKSASEAYYADIYISTE